VKGALRPYKIKVYKQ